MNTEYYILPTSVTLLLINIDVKKPTINVSKEADKQNKLIDKVLLCSQSHEYPVKNNHRSLCLSWCFWSIVLCNGISQNKKKNHNTTRWNAMQHRWLHAVTCSKYMLKWMKNRRKWKRKKKYMARNVYTYAI